MQYATIGIPNVTLLRMRTSVSKCTKHYLANSKTKDRQIIGNAYPEHLLECKPVSNEIQQLQGIDSNCALINAGL
ncbi:hypothetical protein LOAG_13953 [Loa loa]|uniref:Uncharacterized protein n=1 Tax=Loa loa TaxID=7209 RepID=A0A1S0TJJ7_LOALO|nr:hypothetical protein LOAG_13953 [Loa loa]EFO14565.1 hypothetical protein LOAG_13953 [Loa loa]